MTYNLVLKPRAINDLSDNILWYENQEKGLWKRFFRHVESILERIRHYPLTYQIKKPPFREAILKIFPFIIIYEVIKSEVVIYSIFNTHRNPKGKP